MVPTLLEISQRACAKQIKNIRDLGDSPYELVRPMLLKVENPKQLNMIETNSPQLKEHTRELWVEFIKRDIPFWREVDIPVALDSWFDFYQSLREQAAQELELQAEKVKQAMNQANSAKRSTGLVTKKRGLPHQKPTMVQKYANFDRRMGGIEPVFVRAPPSKGNGLTPFSNDSGWTFERPSLRDAPSSAKVRKPALPFLKRTNNKKLSTPTHQLQMKASKINAAPISLVQDYRIQRQIAERAPKSLPLPGSDLKRNIPPQSSAPTRTPPLIKPIISPLAKRKTPPSNIELNRRPKTPPESQKKTDATPCPKLPRSGGLPQKRRSPPNPLLIPKKKLGIPPVKISPGVT